MIDFQEQHDRASRFYRDLAEYVWRRGGERACDRRVLARFDDLSRQVFLHRGSRGSGGRPYLRHTELTYGQLLVKVTHLKVITASRPGVAKPVVLTSRGTPFPFWAPFLSTLSAASILFAIAVHFASVAPDATRVLIGQ